MPRDSISVIIPCHALNEALETCLRSLGTYASDFDELILVTDGFDSVPTFMADIEIQNLKVVATSERSGPAHARNVGASEATGRWLFFLDSDVRLTSNIFELGEKQIREDEQVVAIIGSYDCDPGDQSTVSLFRNLMHHYVHQTSATDISTFWGACGMIRKDVFHEIGGFDETFAQPSVEDIELGYRLTRQGFKIKLYPEMQVKHLKQWTLIHMLKTDIFFRARPWTRLLVQYRSLKDNNLNVSSKEKWVATLMSLTFVSLLMSLINPIFLAFFIAFVGLAIVAKYHFYQFMVGHMGKRNLPWIVLLHGAYYLSALVGFTLGKFDHLQAIISGRPIANTPVEHQSSNR